MKALPKQVKIGPITYDVEVTDRLANDGMWGQIVYGESRIEMNPIVQPQHRAVTLWHEMLHGMLLQGGIREHDERILDVLAYGIVGVLKENPELLK